jgi:hypothetical protein
MDNEIETESFTARLPVALLERLRERARQNQRTLSAEVRFVLLKDCPEPQPPARRKAK